jgi:hypothetical protein
MSKLVGDSNAIYLLQASGAAHVGGGGLAMGDAEYDDWIATGTGAHNNDGNYDFGIGVDDSTISRTEPPARRLRRCPTVADS